MPPRRARFTSGQPPPLLPLMSSAGRHYRAARASAAAASSQKPARAPVVRGHTPSRRAPPPPAFRSERAPPSAAGWLSALCRCSQALQPRRASPVVCTLQGRPLVPWRAGVAAGGGRPLPQRAQVSGLRGSCGHCPGPPSLFPADLPDGGLQCAVHCDRTPGASSS